MLTMLAAGKAAADDVLRAIAGLAATTQLALAKLP